MKRMTSNRKLLITLCVSAMLMAMNIAISSFGVPVAGGKIYLNDIIIATAALLLNPFCAFAVGGLGAFLGDLFFYPAPMFVSLVTRGLQAAVISLVAHHTLKSHPKIAAYVGLTLGGIINVAGYTFGKIFIYSTLEYAMLKLPYQIAMALLGIVVAPILVWACGLGKMTKKMGID